MANNNPFLRYLDLGWSLLPLRARGKVPDHTRLPLVWDAGEAAYKPSWKPYQERRPTLDEVCAWHEATRRGNVGIVTGAVSGLVVLDLDGQAAVREAHRWGLPHTLTARTRQGLHVYLAHPGEALPCRTNLLAEVGGVDLRGDGGYVVAPPSLHPSGRRYRWRNLPESCPLAPLPSWLVEALGASLPTAAGPGPDAAARQLAMCGEGLPANQGRRWQAYLEAATGAELAYLRAARPGERNQRLNRAAFCLGQWVGAGLLEEAQVTDTLLQLATQVGLPPREATRTIRSGLGAGQRHPRYLPDWAQGEGEDAGG